jgi:hypothetical protein
LASTAGWERHALVDRWAGNLNGQSYDDLQFGGGGNVNVPDAAILRLDADAPVATATAHPSSAAITLVADAPSIISGIAFPPSAVITLAADAPSAAVTGGSASTPSAVLQLVADSPAVIPPAIHVPSAVLTTTADAPSPTVAPDVRSALLGLQAGDPDAGAGNLVPSASISAAADAPTLEVTLHPSSGLLTLGSITFGGPRTEIAVTVITRDGVTPAAQVDSDHANGMVILENDGTVFVEIVSTDALVQFVGFAIPELVDGQTVANKRIIVPAGDRRFAGPFPPETYNQDDDSILINPSVDGTLKLRAFSAAREVVILDG